MYCGSLFVWEGGRTMEGPPLNSSMEWCAERDVVGEEADSSLLAALARRNDKDFGFCAGVVCWTARRAVTAKKVKIPTLSQNARQGRGTLELFGFELSGTELRDGVKPFCGGDRLNRIGV
jgi:hypothetical protein